MRNWINIINESINEDLTIDSIEDKKIVLKDPSDDEVKILKSASSEKKENILRKLERDIHESAEDQTYYEVYDDDADKIVLLTLDKQEALIKQRSNDAYHASTYRPTSDGYDAKTYEKLKDKESITESEKPMTQKAALAALRAIPLIKAKYIVDTKEYRVTLTGLSAQKEEDVAYYTEDADDAIGTAKEMSKRASK